MGTDVSYVGVADWKTKRELLSAARCLIFPVQREEPFGIVMVAALACGTPVVATRRGAVPEIIKDGVTGETRDRTDELASAFDIIHNISPAACRADALANFDATRIAALYAQIYTQVLDTGKGHSAMLLLFCDHPILLAESRSTDSSSLTLIRM